MTDAQIQRGAVIERSGGRCEFETLHSSPYPDSWFEWVRCDRAGEQTAHIFRRWKCTADTKFVPETALFGCAYHHRKFDAYSLEVRVPLELAQGAWDRIMASVRNEQHKRETRASVGPRPEIGRVPY